MATPANAQPLMDSLHRLAACYSELLETLEQQYEAVLERDRAALDRSRSRATELVERLTQLGAGYEEAKRRTLRGIDPETPPPEEKLGTVLSVAQLQGVRRERENIRGTIEDIQALNDTLQRALQRRILIHEELAGALFGSRTAEPYRESSDASPDEPPGERPLFLDREV